MSTRAGTTADKLRQSANTITNRFFSHIENTYEADDQLIDAMLQQIFLSPVCLKYWGLAFVRYFTSTGQRSQLPTVLGIQLNNLLFSDLNLYYSPSMLNVFHESSYEVRIKELDFVTLSFLLSLDARRSEEIRTFRSGGNRSLCRIPVTGNVDKRKLLGYRMRGVRHILLFVLTVFNRQSLSTKTDNSQALYIWSRSLASVISSQLLPELAEAWQTEYRTFLFNVFSLCTTSGGHLDSLMNYLRCNEEAQTMAFLFQCGACRMLSAPPPPVTATNSGLFFEIVRQYDSDKKKKNAHQRRPKRLDIASDNISPPSPAPDEELQRFFTDMLYRPVSANDYQY
jgi:hypothetical protein